jgi:Protein of unknown function (DUF3443)
MLHSTSAASLRGRASFQRSAALLSLGSISLGAIACGGGKETATQTGPTADNVTPLIVNGGPPGLDPPTDDVPFASVTLCVPGTTNCQTIDYVTVDTGSSGMRVVSSVLASTLALPAASASTGSPLAECLPFADGFTWGSVRLADIKIGGELAKNVPIQVIGDPGAGAIPSDCAGTGTEEDTVALFGANGLVGINQIVPDCGDACANPANVLTGAYYSCTASACSAVAVPNGSQVSNPIASFAKDNNGAVIQFPAVPAGGAATLSGSLIFGIGTESNNALGSASVLTVDPNGNFTTIFNGATFSASFLDSGSNAFAFNDTSITECPSAGFASFYCPASPLSLTAQNKGQNGITTSVSFSVESAETLFGNGSYTAFDDVATTGIDTSSFDWGLPFFLGRSVYVALEGAATPGGSGPYFAY